ncbi:hypothetical protein ABNX05_00030 [Lysinibacillus sp. M3]|uniref:Uncharacterized protein n=1 Tax=Lysinibacillus zambalensis TaxID=3160866 RepID=A0ABV1MKG3_9BACI
MITGMMVMGDNMVADIHITRFRQLIFIRANTTHPIITTLCITTQLIIVIRTTITTITIISNTHNSPIRTHAITKQATTRSL